MTLLHRHVRHRAAAAVAALRRRLQGPGAVHGTATENGGSADGLAGDAGSYSASPSGAGAPSAGPSSAAASPGHSVSPAPGTPRSPGSPRSPLSPMSTGGGRRVRRRPRSDDELCRAHGSVKYSLPGHDLSATVGSLGQASLLACFFFTRQAVQAGSRAGPLVCVQKLGWGAGWRRGVPACEGTVPSS